MREKIKMEDFYAEAAALESMNEELTDSSESMAWMICVYFCTSGDYFSDIDEFPYKRVDQFEERGEYGMRYYGIWERKSDGKLFSVWCEDYEEYPDEILEVFKKEETVTKYN